MAEMMILCLLGTSGSGKSTIASELERHKVSALVSHRTREKRLNEQHGIDGFFISREEFLVHEKAGAFCATTEYAGNLYGLAWNELDHFKMLGKKVVSYVVDVTGLEGLKKAMEGNESYHIVSVGICSSEEMLRDRMQKRGDAQEKIEERMKMYPDEQSKVLSAVNYVLINQDGKLKTSVNDILEIIEREKA